MLTRLLAKQRIIAGLLACAALVLCRAETPRAEAQADTAIEGRVLDPAGNAVPGARVVAVAAAVSLTCATGPDGSFHLAVPPGDYTVAVTAEGFADSVAHAGAAAGPSVPLVIRLQIQPRSEVVTVTETPAYVTQATNTATKTPTALIDIPQSVSVVSRELIQDQMMMSIADVVRYVPGITAIQGENNRDQIVIRGNSSSADFFVNGVRDDVQYYRDLYNVERVEALKGPNAMVFGRGGGGGVINRATKQAGPAALHEFGVQAGAFGNARFTTDYDQPLGEKAAMRLNGVFERSDGFRDYAALKRYGVNPAVTLTPGQNTRMLLSYEHFRDNRTADRGIPSLQGRPADIPISTFFGHPDDSRVRAGVNLGSAILEHQAGRFTIRNATLIADYDRAYKNYVPGAVNTGRMVAISAYSNATARRNAFNQTDVSSRASTGALRHTLLWGAEVGRQATGNFRNTGYFDNGGTSIAVPLESPVLNAPAAFRQSVTDADNRVTANIAAAYAQDQVELSRHVQVVAGVRIDRFNLRFHNNRDGAGLRRLDHLVSPRAGVIFKPAAAVSLYTNYSVSWLPSSGDQFSSLTTITQQVKPEKFTNYEAGVKWDLRRSLSLTAAVYRLDRTNTRATDPGDPTRIVQTGSQRSNGIELGWNGVLTRNWQVAGGYAYQDAFVTRATVSARAGAKVAQVPHHSFSMWNNYRILPKLSAGIGILNRSDMFAAIDNTVMLPAYTRADVAAYYSITERVRFQVNVENILNRRYYINADGNNNISPGSSRAARAGLIARF